MLIVCAGPDTFRAQRKAQELERAFCLKHDHGAYSMERLPIGKDAADAVLERLNTVSLFGARRFLRTSGLIGDCPKAKLVALVAALARDADGVIVVTQEDDRLTAEQKKMFSAQGKCVEYAFPILSSGPFLAFAKELAALIGLAWSEDLNHIADAINGDSWLLWNEWMKLAAGGVEERVNEGVGADHFALAEHFLEGRKDFFAEIFYERDVGDLLPLFVSQARSAVRVRDRATSGVHPYVVRKMERVARAGGIDEKAKRILFVQMAQRMGFCDAEDAMMLV